MYVLGTRGVGTGDYFGCMYWGLGVWVLGTRGVGTGDQECKYWGLGGWVLGTRYR